MIKAVVFDLNGTLTDDLEYHVKAYYETINEAGIQVSEEDIEGLLGKPCEAITKIFEEESGKEVDVGGLCKEKRKRFLELTEGKEGEVLVKGAESVLKELSDGGILLGLFTGSSRDNILLSEELFGLFGAVVAGPEVGRPKPDGEGLERIMKELGVGREECLYVGDLPIDMETAKNAGVRGIAFKTEGILEEELMEAGAEKVIKELKELLDVIK